MAERPRHQYIFRSPQVILMCIQVWEPLVWTVWVISRKKSFRNKFMPVQHSEQGCIQHARFVPWMKQKCHGFFNDPMCQYKGHSDFYIHCGFEVKKLVEILRPYFKTIPTTSTSRKGERKSLSPEKRKHQISPCFFWHLRWTFTACFNVQTGQKMHMIVL